MPKANKRSEREREEKTETTFDPMEKLQCGRQSLPDGPKSGRYALAHILVDSDNEHHEYAAIC